MTHRIALTLALTPLLSTGTVTLVMLAQGLAGQPLDVWLALFLSFTAWASASIVVSRSSRNVRPQAQAEECCTRAAVWWIAVLCLALTLAAVALNALLWPFYRDDAVALYEPFARHLASTRALVPVSADSLYALYPQHIPMAYAGIFQVAGWANPYPARLVGTILSLTTLPAAFALAWQLSQQNRLAAWAALLLMTTMPTWAHWASSGYVDLPTAALTTLAALFTMAVWEHGRPVDTILAGVCVGLAAWTKNAALISCVVYAGVMTYLVWRRKATLPCGAAGVGVAALISGPWYLRNLLASGTLNPSTVWTDQAETTWRTALALVAQPQDYTLSGWVLLAGVLYAVTRAARGHRQSALLLAWAAPTYILWLAYASYDSRFLLLIVPMLAAAGGTFLADVWRRVPHQRPRLRAGLKAIAITALVLLTIISAEHAVEHKRELLANPWMTHAERRAVVIPAEPLEGRPPPP